MLLAEEQTLKIKPKRKDWFDNFIKARSHLIEEYESGAITKREFLFKNIDYFSGSNMRPFLYINHYEKGIFNYQYYNTLAKYYYMMARDERALGAERRRVNHCLNLSRKYYDLKDQATLDILKLVEFEQVKAYFIETNSRRLKDRLYEIVILNKEEAVFHSKSEKLLEVLNENSTFIEGTHISVIENYINEGY